MPDLRRMFEEGQWAMPTPASDHCFVSSSFRQQQWANQTSSLSQPTRLYIHMLIHSFICCLTNLCTHSVVHSSIHPSVESFGGSLTPTQPRSLCALARYGTSTTCTTNKSPCIAGSKSYYHQLCMLLTAAQFQESTPQFCTCLAQQCRHRLVATIVTINFTVIIVILIIIVVYEIVIISVFTTTITGTMATAAYLMYSPGRQLKVLRAYSMSSSFSAKWVCKRTPWCWRASLAAAFMRSCVTLKGAQGAKPILSMEYLPPTQLLQTTCNCPSTQVLPFPREADCMQLPSGSSQ